MKDRNRNPAIENIPLDILFLIFDLFDHKEQPLLAKVCKLWLDCLQICPSARSKRYLDYPLPLECKCASLSPDPSQKRCHPVLKIHRLLRLDEWYSCHNPLEMKDDPDDPVFIFPAIPSCPNRFGPESEKSPITSPDHKQAATNLDAATTITNPERPQDNLHKGSHSQEESTVTLSQAFNYRYITACVFPITLANGGREFSGRELVTFTPTDTVIRYAGILSDRMKQLTQAVFNNNDQTLRKTLGTRHSHFEFNVHNCGVFYNSFPVSLRNESIISQFSTGKPQRGVGSLTTRKGPAAVAAARARRLEYQYY